MKTMTFNHWDVLQLTYSDNMMGFYPTANRYEKRMLKALLKAGWVEIVDDDRVRVTEEGMRAAAEQITALYE